ncbi:prostamide/prostaglandin F synthase-like [Ornithodoros turicata]|uniref:prostamide/prostaglandin F synthase-like n=1 Tax=Ornithodoros turicata TaxID=34597 RepID=UPI003139E130
MSVANEIGKFYIKSASTGQSVSLGSLWQDKTCVLMFFRRFACPFCRLDAVRISEIKPKLDAADVSLIGIGHEETGLKEFLEKGFFKGDLYIDGERNTYKALNFKRYNILSIFPAILTSASRAKAAAARDAAVGGDMTTGDGLQTGGTLIVEKGGSKVLLNYKQDTPDAYVGNDAILKALGLDPESSKD